MDQSRRLPHGLRGGEFVFGNSLFGYSVHELKRIRLPWEVRIWHLRHRVGRYRFKTRTEAEAFALMRANHFYGSVENLERKAQWV